MTRIKRFYDVHEPNENFLKYGVSITSEMAFTEESLLLRKGHFLSRKRGRLFKKYFFRSLNGAFKPRKRALFSLLKKPPHVPRPLSEVRKISVMQNDTENHRSFLRRLSYATSSLALSSTALTVLVIRYFHWQLGFVSHTISPA
jgi:hypothetical protein